MPPEGSGHDGGITQFAVSVESVDYVISRRAQASLGDNGATATSFLAIRTVGTSRGDRHWRDDGGLEALFVADLRGPA